MAAPDTRPCRLRYWRRTSRNRNRSLGRRSCTPPQPGSVASQASRKTASGALPRRRCCRRPPVPSSPRSPDLLAVKPESSGPLWNSVVVGAMMAQVACRCRDDLDTPTLVPGRLLVQHCRSALPSAHTGSRLRARPQTNSGADIDPELQAPRPPERRSTEECALQQVILVEYVVDIQLWANDRAADGERVPDTRIDDDVRIHVDVLVEVEQAPSIRRIRIGSVGETGPIDARRGQVESATRVDRAGNAGQALVVVEVEIPRR